jgi:hypothetical protein
MVPCRSPRGKSYEMICKDPWMPSMPAYNVIKDEAAICPNEKYGDNSCFSSSMATIYINSPHELVYVLFDKQVGK